MLVYVLMQIVAAWLIGVVSVYALGIGNGWELAAIPLGTALGVWGVGALVDRLRDTDDASAGRFLFTLVGSALGMAIPVLQPIGIAGVLLPLLGALAGYWFLGRRKPAA